MVKLICILTQSKKKWYVTGSTGRSFTWHSGQAPAVSCLPADYNQEGTVASVRPVFLSPHCLIWRRKAGQSCMIKAMVINVEALSSRKPVPLSQAPLSR